MRWVRAVLSLAIAGLAVFAAVAFAPWLDGQLILVGLFAAVGAGAAAYGLAQLLGLNGLGRAGVALLAAALLALLALVAASALASTPDVPWILALAAAALAGSGILLIAHLFADEEPPPWRYRDD